MNDCAARRSARPRPALAGVPTPRGSADHPPIAPSAGRCSRSTRAPLGLAEGAPSHDIHTLIVGQEVTGLAAYE